MIRNHTLLFSFLVVFMIASCGKEESPTVNPNIDSNSGSIKIIHDDFENTPLVIVGNEVQSYMLAFDRTLADGTILNFEAKQRSLPDILQDAEGNIWNHQGLATSGPREGQRLTKVNAYTGFWFAWGTMYPEMELYDGTSSTSGFQQNPPVTGWNIPTETVLTVLGPDAIPAVDDPKFEVYDAKDAIDNGYFLEEDDMVIGVTVNQQTRLYPIRILNWHEIVNDVIGDQHFSVSFCPLTNTTVVWDRNIDGNITTFGVSGLLYNSNVMPYDRESGSIWSQMTQDCVTGALIDTEFETYQVFTTTFATWKTMLSTLNVLSTDTGFGKDYDINPYASYLTNDEFIAYPIEYHDTRLLNKETILGVEINGKAKGYRFNDFED